MNYLHSNFLNMLNWAYSYLHIFWIKSYMSQRFFNKHTLGSFDFINYLIEIDNELFGKTTEEVIKIINADNISELHDKDLELYQTYIHEMTHFLDLTTTLWGLEYSGRMYRYFQLKTDNSLEVFTLNDCEIMLHHHCYAQQITGSFFNKVKYSERYDRDNGVIVLFHYFDEFDKELHSRPLSMLALLEGHAYCKEMLLAINKYNKENDFVSLSLLERKIESQVFKLESCEYTSFLALIFQIMPKASLQCQLEFLCKVFEFCLDIPVMYMAMTPRFILELAFWSAEPQIISSLEMEFNRSQSRHVLALVFIIYILHRLRNDNIELNANTINEIDSFIVDIYICNDESPSLVQQSIEKLWAIDYEIYLELVNEQGAGLVVLMANQRKKLGWKTRDVKDFQLPDFYLSNCDIVSPKKRLDFDIEKHFSLITSKSKGLEEKLKQYGIKKEHLNPSFCHGWLQHIAHNSGSGIYIHNQ